MLEFHLDRSSGVPSYRQLVDQVKHALRLGILQPGDQVPTTREVVAKLAINPNTVLRAYRDLEHEGLVIGRPGLGTFIQRGLGGTSLADHTALRSALGQWVDSARSAGLVQEDLHALFLAVVTESYRADTA